MMVLDIDMDYFMDEVATGISEQCTERLTGEYDNCVWSEKRVRDFLEINLGLSNTQKVKGRIVTGHNEALFFWSELIDAEKLKPPFEVIHVDAHADLGLGYSSWAYIINCLLSFPPEERPSHNEYIDAFGRQCKEGIGDYLLFAIAYRWISKLTYCANPHGEKNDYLWETLKNFHENYIWDEPVQNVIQLVYNPDMPLPKFRDSEEIKEAYLSKGKREPEVPLTIIPTIENVKFSGAFDYIVFAQSPNYTPQSADFILEIIREYIDLC